MKRRAQIQTTMAYGEGSNDETWLIYIKELYAKGKRGIKIKNGGGGSPESVIIRMTKNIAFSEYERKFALIDSDRGHIDEARNLAKKNGITLIVSNQCLEVELLKIKNVSKSVRKIISTNSKEAKKEFLRRCSHNQDNYRKVFPKKVLNSERKKSKWLDSIIRIFEE